METIAELQEQLRHAVGAKQFDILNKLSLNLISSDLSLAEKYAREAFALARADKRNAVKAEAYYTLGHVLFHKDEFNQAKDHFYEALRLGRHRPHLVSRVYNSLGGVYSQLGEFEQALSYYFKSLETWAAEPDVENTNAAVYINIANLYRSMDEFDLALDFCQRALTGLKKNPRDDWTASAYSALSDIYGKMMKYDRAIHYAALAIRLNHRRNNRLSMANLQNNLGIVYSKQGKPDKALKSYQKALEIYREFDAKAKIAAALNNIGFIYHQQSQFNQAICCFRESLALSRAVGQKEWQCVSLWKLAESTAELGDAKTSFEYIKQYASLNEQLFNEKEMRAIAEMQTKYEIAQKEAENLRLQQEVQTKIAELKHLSNHLANSNRIIRQLRQELDKQLSEAPQTYHNCDQILNQIENSINSPKGWMELESRFIELYPEIITILETRFPALTRQQRRICILVMIGQTTPQIAETLYLSKRSIETHRHHLRKKLQIPRNQDLRNFLHNLTQS